MKKFEINEEEYKAVKAAEKEETTSLKTIKCTAKANTQATSDVMSGKPENQ